MRVEEESDHDDDPAVQEVQVGEESGHDDDPAVQEVVAEEGSGHDDDRDSGLLEVVAEEFDHDGAEPYRSSLLHKALRVKCTSSLLLDFFKLLKW